MDDFLSDQDEWDVLDDETLKKTINDHDGIFGIVKKFDIGDRVEAVGGQYKSIKGIVTKIVDDNYRNSLNFNLYFSLHQVHRQDSIVYKGLDKGPPEVL